MTTSGISSGGSPNDQLAVRRLAPGGPVHRHVRPDPGRLLLAGQAVGGLPRDVTEEHVDLEPLLDRLTLEKRPFEGTLDSADDMDELMVEHGEAEDRRLGCYRPSSGRRTRMA